MNEIERMSIYQKLIREVFPYLKNEMIPECILWEVLSCHQHITMDIIDKYSDKPWVWWLMSESNPNLTLELVNKYPDKNWNWEWISEHPHNANKILENELF